MVVLFDGTDRLSALTCGLPFHSITSLVLSCRVGVTAVVVVECRWLQNYETGLSKGYGFVVFDRPNDCHLAAVQGRQIIDGKEVPFFLAFLSALFMLRCWTYYSLSPYPSSTLA